MEINLHPNAQTTPAIRQALQQSDRSTRELANQTNGMIERFNGRIADVLATTRFDSSESLAFKYLIKFNVIFDRTKII